MKKYLENKVESFKSEVPVIVVGNLTIGGTGKTPTSIFLANELKKIGKNPVIVKKFYEDQKDEQELIKKYFEIGGLSIHSCLFIRCLPTKKTASYNSCSGCVVQRIERGHPKS